MRLSDIDVFKTFKKWEMWTGPFRSFFRKTNFVSLKHYPDFELVKTFCEPSHIEYIKELIEKHIDDGTVFFIDLSGEEAIEIAKSIEKSLLLKPILTFNNVLHPQGLICSQRYISSLLDYNGIEEKCNIKGYAFICDNSRYGDFSEKQLRKYFNNQYELTDDDLPPLEMLEELGYSRAVIVYNNDIKDDLANYVEYLIDGGLKVDKLDISKEIPGG